MDLAAYLLIVAFLLVVGIFSTAMWFIHPALSAFFVVGVLYFTFRR